MKEQLKQNNEEKLTMNLQASTTVVPAETAIPIIIHQNIKCRCTTAKVIIAAILIFLLGLSSLSLWQIHDIEMVLEREKQIVSTLTKIISSTNNGPMLMDYKPFAEKLITIQADSSDFGDQITKVTPKPHVQTITVGVGINPNFTSGNSQNSFFEELNLHAPEKNTDIRVPKNIFSQDDLKKEEEYAENDHIHFGHIHY